MLRAVRGRRGRAAVGVWVMALAAIPVAVAQNSPAWLDARRGVIGSSDMPTLTGTSPFRTSKLSLWAIKTRLLEPEPVDPIDQERFDLGHAMEPVIAARCPHIKPAKPRAGLFLHPEHRWIGASLDRYNRRERIVHELKWRPNHSFDGGPEPVPADVQDQVQSQMMVMGDGWRGHVSVLTNRIQCFDLEPDKGYQADLLYIATRFHDDHMVTGIAPAPDESEETRRTLLRLHPRDTLGFIEPTAEIEAMVRELCTHARSERIEGKETARLKNVLRAVLEEHAGVEGDGWKVTYRKSKDSAKDVTNYELVAKAYRRLLDVQASGKGWEDLPWEERRVAGSLSPDELDAIESLYTQHVVKEGARPLLGPWSKEEEA